MRWNVFEFSVPLPQNDTLHQLIADMKMAIGNSSFNK